MLELTTRLVEVLLQTHFKKPVLNRDAHYDNVALKCWEAYSSYGLTPTDIKVQTGDIGFNHQLFFQLFNGNGTFKVTAEKAEVFLKNAVGRSDFDIIVDCINKFYGQVPLPEYTHTAVTASAHSQTTPDEYKKYMAQFTNPEKKIIHGGAIVHALCEGWPSPIRMTMEPSVVYSDAIFFTWQTTLVESKVMPAALELLNKACDDAAAKMDIVFAKTE